MRKLIIAGAITAIGALSIPALASASFDVDDNGVGFVGKGDVQYTMGGWNNQQLQQTPVSFTYEATNVKVTEVDWTCTNDKNEKQQERARVTTTTNSKTALVSSAARVKNQITGFNLTGWNGDPTVKTSEKTDGPQVNSCPANPQGDTWTLTTPAGDPVEVSNTTEGGLYVNGKLLVSPPPVA